MHLGLVTHKLIRGDGQGRVNYEIVVAALAQGHQVTVLASEVEANLPDHPGVRWIPIASRRLPTALLQNYQFSRQSAHWLRHHRQEIDVLHINGCITSVPSDVNASHFVHNAWLKSPVRGMAAKKGLRYGYQSFYTHLNARSEVFAYQKAKIVVAVSENVRQELIDAGIASEQIRVILNGVDIVEFSPGTEGRPPLGLPESVPLALFVGDIRTPRKNLDTVLRALIHVPNLHCAVVGSTDKSPYPAMAKALNLAGRVHFLGFRRDVAAIMRAADLFVFPSRYEACSLVLLEALSSGLPVITARTAGGAEMISAEAGVVLDNPNDVDSLVASLHCVLAEPTLWHVMGQQARLIAKLHTWTRMGSDYLAVYEEIARTKNLVLPVCAE